MSRLKLYFHGGSSNHGCEAIVRSTSKILDSDMDLFSTASQEDIFYNLSEIVNVYNDNDEILTKKSICYIISALEIKLKGTTLFNTKYRRQILLNHIHKNDICFSIGGDNYCYTGVEVLGDLNYLFKKKKAKTVLWGCSIEPKIINKSVANDLKRYDLITVRETLTKEGLNKNGIRHNVKLYPDPAFQLDKIDLPLPEHFVEGNTVGINVSPLIMSCETNEGITKENYIQLIDYIIKETDMNIALIPHVIKLESDDRKPLKELYDLFKHTQRVCLIDDHNCMELKGFISRCRFFVGARTHATIAAYSTCVPTLVVGYSVKAKGIAKDIFGTYDHYVLPVQSLNAKDDLVKSFQWLVNHETNIKNHLHDFMPGYKEKALEAGDEIRRLLY